MSGDRFARAEAGFAEGLRYERARPGYPVQAIGRLCERLGVGPGRRVLDLAAGTGKLTRELAGRGAEVVAVEPVAGMRARLVEALPGARVLAGTAERIPLADGSVDAVTVAQAFHWFDGPAALREIRRVLAPAGSLGLIWNVMDRAVPWVDRLQDLIHRHRGENPWYAGHGWRRAFEGDTGFGELRHEAFRNAQAVDREGLVERVASISFIATLGPGPRKALLEDARTLVDREGVVDRAGWIEIPYVTDLFWCGAPGRSA